jgi:hypothetical protein
MTELLISEITRMANGLCVIGLEGNKDSFRSVRPMPRSGHAWRNFPYQRADRTAFHLSAMQTVQPHLEDRLAAYHHRVGAVAEAELVACLRNAEMAGSLKEMFGCQVRPSRASGESFYVLPGEAQRSISGCEIVSVKFSFRYYPPTVRAALALKSGETLVSLPLVDRDWHQFIGRIEQQIGAQPQAAARLQEIFDSFVLAHITPSPMRFARIGITRPDPKGSCWLMLDSLFPLPKSEWLQKLAKQPPAPH